MKLWLVIYIAGQIAAVLGPLAPDEAACRKQAENYEVHIEPDPTAPPGSREFLGTVDVRIECEWSSHRPEGGVPLEQLDD